MSDKLNPELYDLLVRRGYRFRGGELPRVANPGQVLRAHYKPTRYTYKDRPRFDIEVLAWGEAYLADCPFCHDRRGRLSVSYHYMVEDEEANRKFDNLWRCYNEECQADPANRLRLKAELYPSCPEGYGFAATRSGLYPPLTALRVKPRPPERVRQVELPPVEAPGECVRLDVDVPETAMARQYLTFRGFDVAELARDWGVRVCVHVGARARGSYCMGRIIVPVVKDGVVVGFQARYVGDPDWKQVGVTKYLTFYPKAQTLYGYDEAKRTTGPLVVFEGVTDLWRFGQWQGGVARFGKRLSLRQTHLLVELAMANRHLGRDWRPVVFVPDADDPDAAAELDKDVRDLTERGYYGGAVHVAWPPAGLDAGALERDDLRRLVAAALAGEPYRLGSNRRTS